MMPLPAPVSCTTKRYRQIRRYRRGYIKKIVYCRSFETTIFALMSNSIIFTDKDWMEFKRLYLDDLYRFTIKGAVDQKSSQYPDTYHHVFKYANLKTQTTSEIQGNTETEQDNTKKRGPHRMFLQLNKLGYHLSNISKSDVCNAIDEFRKTISLSNMSGDILPLLRSLNNESVTQMEVNSAMYKSEGFSRYLIEEYFGIEPTNFVSEYNDLGGEFDKCVKSFGTVLSLYYHPIHPLSLLKDCRNQVHYVPETGSIEGPTVAQGEQSRELVKFVVFTFIWIITLCRKIIFTLSVSNCELYITPPKRDLKQPTSDVTEKERKEKERKEKERIQKEQKKKEEDKPKVIALNGCTSSKFEPGMDLSVAIVDSKTVGSIEWVLGEDKNSPARVKGNCKCKGNKCTIPGIFRYENIHIKVYLKDNTTVEFEPFQLEWKHSDKINLQCEYRTVEKTDNYKPANRAKKRTQCKAVELTLKTDLGCTLEVSGIKEIVNVPRGQYATVKVPKGTHIITLISVSNPKYKMTREVDIIKDTVIDDMLFATEVHQHREWWNIDDIVVLKGTVSDEDNYVLWDKTVDLPVYLCRCYSENDFLHSETGFAGNLFYVKDTDGWYRYYDLTDRENDQIFSKRLFTFSQKTYRTSYELTGSHGKGDALVIDENGKTLYTIFKADGWNENLVDVYEEFKKKFRFSERWAAMLLPDGKTIRFVNDDWQTDRDKVYDYDSDNYPIFHNNYCAVRKDGHYHFLKDNGSFLIDTADKYDYLEPVLVKDEWIYIVKKDGKYSFRNLEKDVELNSLKYDLIEYSHGLFRVKGNEWGVFDSKLEPVGRTSNVFEPEILSDKFVIWDKKSSDEYYPRYLCAKDQTLIVDFLDYKIINDSEDSVSADFVAIKSKDSKWHIFDAESNRYLTDYDDFSYYKSGIFILQKDKKYQCWKAEGSKLQQIYEGDWMFIEQSELYIYHTSKSPIPKDKTIELVFLFKSRLEPDYKTVSSICFWGTLAAKSSPDPFLDKGAQITLMTQENMDKLASEATKGAYIHFCRAGNLWISNTDNKKIAYTPSITQFCEGEEVIYINEDYLYIKQMNKYFIWNTQGIRISAKPYQQIRPMTNGFAAVRANCWGFIQILNGKVQEIEPKYYDVMDFTEDGYAMVQKEEAGSWGLIDTNGELVVDCLYDHVDPFRCGCNFTSVKKGKKWKIIRKG